MRISDWSSDVCSSDLKRPMASIKNAAPGTTVKYRLPSIHPEGVKFVVIAAAICAFFAFMGWETLAWPMAGIALWVAAFFRDPIRVTPNGEGIKIGRASVRERVCQSV